MLMANILNRTTTEQLFDQFMSQLTTRGILRRIPLRHIKVVFFNYLAAVGNQRDKNKHRDLMEKYLNHFNRADVDNERRFTLSDAAFKKTSELLDRLLFNYLSDSFSAPELPRPQFTTRPTPAWITKPSKTTPTFGLPSLEESSTYHPYPVSTSTTTFGGVASNTARPTTKSMMAEMEYPSNPATKPKYQFMHDPAKFRPTETPLNDVTSSSLSTSFGDRLENSDVVLTTTSRPPFYPQLINQSPEPSSQTVSFRPNFNNKQTTTRRSTTTMRSTTSMPDFLQGNNFKNSPEIICGGLSVSFIELF